VTQIFHNGQPSRGGEFAKFRCDVAPLKIETERYDSLLFEIKICFNNPCRINNCIEDEKHDLLDCPRLGLLCLTPLLTIWQIRHHDLVDRYGIFVSQMTTDIFHLS
jgi:hypothetical protein